MSRETGSITVSGSLSSSYDLQTFERLSIYCERMGLELAAVQSGNRIDLRITGTESGLSELMDYLEQRKSEARRRA